MGYLHLRMALAWLQNFSTTESVRQHSEICFFFGLVEDEIAGALSAGPQSSSSDIMSSFQQQIQLEGLRGWFPLWAVHRGRQSHRFREKALQKKVRLCLINYL